VRCRLRPQSAASGSATAVCRTGLDPLAYDISPRSSQYRVHLRLFVSVAKNSDTRNPRWLAGLHEFLRGSRERNPFSKSPFSSFAQHRGGNIFYPWRFFRIVN
jgi:hypothetical protein